MGKILHFSGFAPISPPRHTGECGTTRPLSYRLMDACMKKAGRHGSSGFVNGEWAMDQCFFLFRFFRALPEGGGASGLGDGYASVGWLAKWVNELALSNSSTMLFTSSIEDADKQLAWRCRQVLNAPCQTSSGGVCRSNQRNCQPGESWLHCPRAARPSGLNKVGLLMVSISVP